MDSERKVNAYVGSVVAVATLALVASIFILYWDTTVSARFRLAPLDMPIALGIAFLFIVLHRNPFTFHWREQRLVVSLDEAGILVGLLVMPAPLLPIVVGIASSIAQVWGGPRSALKRAFNISQYALATACTAAVFVMLLSSPIPTGGLPSLIAAAIAAMLFGTIANLLLAGVFASLSGESMFTVFRERFLVSGANSAIIGVAGGLTLVALWRVNPFLTLCILPIAYLVRQNWKLYASADRELDVHRHLANATHDLVGTSSITAVAERVLAECERLLDCGRAELVLDGHEPFAREFGSGPRRQPGPIVVSIPARDGGTLGELRVWARQGKDPFGEQERAMVRTISGQGASAVENARAILAVDAARKRLDTYLSTAQDAVLLVEPDGSVRYMNPAALHLFGIDAADVTKHRASDFFEDPRLVGISAGQDEPGGLVETEAHDAAGTNRYLVEAHSGPVVENGVVTGVVTVIRDVTERKRLEDEAKKQREALMQNEKLSALGTLVAGVAHEINNPLTYMRGHLQLAEMTLQDKLAEEGISEEQRAFVTELNDELRIAVEGADRIAQISQSLKNVARRGTADRKSEDLNRVVNDVVAVVKTGIPRNVRLELELRADLPRVVVQTSEIHQVVLNLIKNACEALEGRQDGHVTVRTFADDAGVHLAVQDNGPGIPEDVQKSLFTPFFTTKEKGTGLGLSISERIVRSHGGEMTLDSTVGLGTTFSIRLPPAPVPGPAGSGTASA